MLSMVSTYDLYPAPIKWGPHLVYPAPRIFYPQPTDTWSISMFEAGLTPRLTEGLDVVLTAGLDAALDAAALGVALRLAILTAATLAIASVVSTD